MIPRRDCLLLAAALGAGCSVLREPAPGPGAWTQWESRRRRLAALGGFSFSGRLAVRSPEEAWNVRIRWVQDGGEYRIRLAGLLGEGAVELRGGAGAVELRSAHGVYRADSPESLLRERTGWSVPLEGLRHWVLGTAVPGAALGMLELDEQGRPAHFVQSEWRIAVRRYTSVQGLSLPERLDLDNPHLGARLVVSRWSVEG